MPTIPKHDSNWKPRPKQTGRRYHDKRYSTAKWQRLRRAFIAQFPICDLCGRAAQVVDHISQVSTGGSFWNGPFRPLCSSCHNRVSGAQRQGKHLEARRTYPFGDGPP